MKILLQHAHTKLYYSLVHQWIGDIRCAHDFRHSQKALEFAHRQGLTSVQLVVKFEDPQFDEIFSLPVPVGTIEARATAA